MKINQLLRQWPAGKIATSTWLQKQGLSRQLIHAYVKRGWIDKVGHGSYKRGGDNLAWPAVLDALMSQLELPLHLGGASALTYWGYEHFVPIYQQELTLFNHTQELVVLPTWVQQYPWNDAAFVYIQKTIFDVDYLGELSPQNKNSCEFVVSEPERAVLEMLSLVPKRQAYDDAIYRMESLLNLRPQVMQRALERCQSIKVKRLFLHIADLCSLPCVESLQLDKIELGRGKRKIGEGGFYHPKYGLSVPENPLKEGFDGVLPDDLP